MLTSEELTKLARRLYRLEHWQFKEQVKNVLPKLVWSDLMDLFIGLSRTAQQDQRISADTQETEVSPYFTIFGDPSFHGTKNLAWVAQAVIAHQFCWHPNVYSRYSELMERTPGPVQVRVIDALYQRIAVLHNWTPKYSQDFVTPPSELSGKLISLVDNLVQYLDTSFGDFNTQPLRELREHLVDLQSLTLNRRIFSLQVKEYVLESYMALYRRNCGLNQANVNQRQAVLACYEAIYVLVSSYSPRVLGQPTRAAVIGKHEKAWATEAFDEEGSPRTVSDSRVSGKSVSFAVAKSTKIIDKKNEDTHQALQPIPKSAAGSTLSVFSSKKKIVAQAQNIDKKTLSKTPSSAIVKSDTCSAYPDKQVIRASSSRPESNNWYLSCYSLSIGAALVAVVGLRTKRAPLALLGTGLSVGFYMTHCLFAPPKPVHWDEPDFSAANTPM